jgi:hypothetical protein
MDNDTILINHLRSEGVLLCILLTRSREVTRVRSKVSVTLLTNQLRGARPRRFITTFTTARHQPLYWANWIHSIPPHPVSPRSLIMTMGWDVSEQRPSNEPTVHPPGDMWACGATVMMMPSEENSLLVHQSSLAILPAVIWEQVGGMGEGVRILPIQYLKHFKGSLTCRKILQHGADGFTSHPKESVLRIFIALKNPSSRSGLNPRPLSPMASTLTTTPPRRPNQLNPAFFYFCKFHFTLNFPPITTCL